MIFVFSYFMLCFLIPRVVAHWSDVRTANDRLKLFWTVLFELLFLIPLLGGSSFYSVLIFLIGYHIFVFVIKTTINNVYLQRSIEFSFLIIGGGFFLGVFSSSISFSNDLLTILRSIIQNHALLYSYSEVVLQKAVIFLFGIVVVTNEINTIVRFILNTINAEPMLNTETIDSREL